MYQCPAAIIHGEPGECPAGDEPYSTENGAVMHALNKGDDYHSVVDSKPDAYAALADGGEVSVPTTGQDPPKGQDSTGAATAADGPGEAFDVFDPEMPEADDAPTESDTADCPNCGAALGEKSEVEAAIEEHGRIWCDHCNAPVGADS